MAGVLEVVKEADEMRQAGEMTNAQAGEVARMTALLERGIVDMESKGEVRDRSQWG